TPGKLILAASPDGREGSVTIHQDANIYIARMDAKQPILHEIAKDRYAWIQVTRGTLAVNGQSLHAGDGAAMDGGQDINLESDANAEIMIFDLA
ncbi:pirin family protein, partial [Candidatus Sumerlaeota bacterium]|nr:pirin family protein [Candidatus Sumerlaeota bacterium]